MLQASIRGVPRELRLGEFSVNPPVEIPQTVELLRAGRFFHPGEQVEFEITKTMLLSMKNNFELKVREIDLAVDYKHENEDIAAGWFQNIFLADDGATLLAEVKWTPKGEAALRDREFRYISAEFSRDYQKDKSGQKYGPTLLGAGLTNRPVIKGMQPVMELSELPKPTKGANQMDEKDKKIAELEAKVAELTKMLDGQELAAKEVSQKAGDYQKQLGEVTAQLSEKTSALEKIEADKKLAEKKATFDKMLSEGKACEAQRDAYMASDFVKFTELASAVKLDDNGDGTPPPAPVGGDAADQILKLAEKAVADKTVTGLAEGIKKVLRERPELRKEYEKSPA